VSVCDFVLRNIADACDFFHWQLFIMCLSASRNKTGLVTPTGTKSGLVTPTGTKGSTFLRVGVAD
jgi:hypothetical protein